MDIFLWEQRRPETLWIFDVLDESIAWLFAVDGEVARLRRHDHQIAQQSDAERRRRQQVLPVHVRAQLQLEIFIDGLFAGNRSVGGQNFGFGHRQTSRWFWRWSARFGRSSRD